MVVWPDELGRQWLFDATSVPIGMPLPQVFPPKENPEPRAPLERWHSKGWNRSSEWTADDNTAAVEFMKELLQFHNLTCGMWNVAHLTPPDAFSAGAA